MYFLALSYLLLLINPFLYVYIFSRSIMSGDSPNMHRNEMFDFKEGRQSPTPTTSKDGANAIQASIIVEPGTNKKEEEDESPSLVSPILNNAYDESRKTDGDQTMRLDELSYSGKKDDDKDEKRMLNGELDKLDGVWVPSNNTRKKSIEEEDDDKCVNCLYYTMQCCECTII